MTHLSSQELVALAEGGLSADRAAHLDACDRCRDEANDLRAVMSGVQEAEVPEPSPLFWEHLSRRVSDAVASSDTPTRRVAVGWRSWHSGHLRTVVASATVVTMALALSGTSPLAVALPAMVGVHALIGVGEGLITVFALSYIRVARPQLLGLESQAQYAGSAS